MLFTLWSLWVSWAVVIGCVLVYRWIGLAMFLPGCWIVFTAITA